MNNPTIGIITGSGPDAGIDLWQAVLDETRHRLGNSYGGDADAPRVVVVSEPALGASMDLPATHDEVWEALERTVHQIDDQCDLMAIACNTLNVYADDVRSVAKHAALVAYPDAVARWATAAGVERVGLLAAAPVLALDRWSPYTGLADQLELVTPDDHHELHSLIEAIKRDGGADPTHSDRLTAVIDDLPTDDVLLACTELPLVDHNSNKRVIDVTRLVAAVLVDESLSNPLSHPR